MKKLFMITGVLAAFSLSLFAAPKEKVDKSILTTVEEDYDLPFEKGIIAKFKKASDDTVFSVINLFGENYYIPKKSIVYIATGDVEVRE